MGKERFLLDPGRLGLLLTVASATNLVCLPFVGAFADRLGRKALLVPSTFLFGVSLLISAASPTTAIFALALAFYGVAQAMESAAANSYVADLAPPNQRSVALGIHRTFGDAGLVVGSPLLGFIADQLSISWALVINAGIVAIPGALFFFLVKETARERRAAAPSQ